MCFDFKIHCKISSSRTSQLSELKQAGIISLIDKHNVLDKRGIAFKAGYDYYKEYSFDAIQLKNQVKQAKDFEDLNKALAKIEPISREETRHIIKVRAKVLIEAQDVLDEFEEF